MLGIVGREEHLKFLHALETGDRKAVLEAVDSLVGRGKDLEVFLTDLITILRDRLASGESADEARDIALVRGLLEIKQDLYRSLDRRIILEVGLLSLMQALSPAQEEPHTETAPESPLIAAAEKKTPSKEQNGEQKTELEARWEEMLQKIAQERIAIAAFLAEGAPWVAGKKLHIAFHPEYTFHKESLEKPENLQYLAGMVHRYLGDQFEVEVEFDAKAERKPSPREALREKAQLLCQVFDGKIVKEE